MQQEVPLYDGTLRPDGRMRFRIGANIGDVIASGTNLHGNGVNVAARLQSVCPEGGVCVSRVVRDHMRDIPCVTFEELGPLHLKNIARPVEAFLLRLGMPPDVDHRGRPGAATTAGHSRTLRWSHRLTATAGAAALAVCLLLVVGRRGTAHEEAAGRRRPRGGCFCEANRGSASSRALVLVLKSALAAAVWRLWVALRVMWPSCPGNAA